MASSKATDFLNGEVPVVGAKQSDGKAPKIKELTEPAPAPGADKNIECDVLVVGAGFSGISAIYRMRKLGLKVKCFESGGGFGGVWWWNRYPGARVDSEAPFYQLNIPEAYKDWTFSQRFSDHRELRKYMEHIDKTLDLKKDTEFNARVVDASFDTSSSQWIVKTLQGHQARAKYLILATGLLHRTYTPDFPGLADFKGELYHSGAWKDDFTAKGKKVAIIGAGATAVQITQELGKEADELTVFVRRASHCLPMQQRSLTEAEQTQWKAYLPLLFKGGRDSAGGFPVAPRAEGVFDVETEEREQILEQLWKTGGFTFLTGNFRDVPVDVRANREVYDFWKRKVRARLTDPAKHQIMAPDEPSYYFGTKRCPLEADYYDVLNQPNVQVHDLSAIPLKSFAERGLVMADDKLREFDAVVLATGFDSYTGSLTNMGLKNTNGVELKDLWKDGVHTYLGLMVSGFPNMFMAYSPQAPTPLANGTTIIEAQVDLIAEMISKLQHEGAHSIEPEQAAEEQWKAAIDEVFKHVLMAHTDSWWNGSNIPGKKKEALVYLGGVNTYEAECRSKLDGWQGFKVAPAAETATTTAPAA